MELFKPCTHKLLKKKRVKSLFLIKHLTSEKRDTPLILFFYIFLKEVNLTICKKNKWLEMWQSYFISFCSFLETPLIRMRWDACYGLRQQLNVAQVCAQEVLTHLYADVIVEHHAW